MKRPGIVVLSFGGPRSASELEPFLHNLFEDVLPFPGLVRRLAAGWVARRRAPKVLPVYDRIGWSPVVPTTLDQCDALRAALHDDGLELPIVAGMMYTAPTIADAVEALLREDIDGILAVTTFPQYSLYTAGSAFEMLVRALDAAGRASWPVHFIPAWHTRAPYVAGLVDTVRTAIGRLPRATPEHPRHVLFSPHGIPVAGVRRGDPYPDQIRETCRRVMEGLGLPLPWSIGWQSRLGPARWVGPSTVDEVRRLAACGVRELVVVPVSFVGEHIETLAELDVDLAEQAHAAGIPTFARAPALGVHPGLVRALADAVGEACDDLGTYRCFRCLVPREASHRLLGTCPNCRAHIPSFLRRHPATDRRIPPDPQGVP